MKIYDGGKIIPGLIVFLGLVCLPILYNMSNGAAEAKPELVKPAGMSACIEDSEYMRRAHMDLLVDWRETVVRTGERIYTSTSGEKWVMSLSGTCLDCHENKQEFCNRCHDYMGVKPYCWDCHIEPQGD
jgi:hypothetical protein